MLLQYLWCIGLHANTPSTLKEGDKELNLGVFGGFHGPLLGGFNGGQRSRRSAAPRVVSPVSGAPQSARLVGMKRCSYTKLLKNTVQSVKVGYNTNISYRRCIFQAVTGIWRRVSSPRTPAKARCLASFSTVFFTASLNTRAALSLKNKKNPETIQNVSTTFGSVSNHVFLFCILGQQNGWKRVGIAWWETKDINITIIAQTGFYSPPERTVFNNFVLLWIMDGRDFGPSRSVHVPPPLLAGLGMEPHRHGAAAAAGRMPPSPGHLGASHPPTLHSGKYLPSAINLHPHHGECSMFGAKRDLSLKLRKEMRSAVFLTYVVIDECRCGCIGSQVSYFVQIKGFLEAFLTSFRSCGWFSGLCTIMENYLSVSHTRTVLLLGCGVAAALCGSGGNGALIACGLLQQSVLKQMRCVFNISVLIFGSVDMNGELVRDDKSLFTP